jgi:hypothetical protein
MKKIISMMGAAAMLIGCFLPIMHAPLLGPISYMVNEDGKLVAIFSVIALLFGLGGRVRIASVGGWLGLLTAIFDFVHFQSLANSWESPFMKFSSLGEAWPVVFIGAVMLIVAAFWGASVPDIWNRSIWDRKDDWDRTAMYGGRPKLTAVDKLSEFKLQPDEPISLQGFDYSNWKKSK